MAAGIAILVDGTPDAGLAGAALVEVHERMGEPTYYRLRLPVDIAGGDLPMLTDARIRPGAMLTILADAGAGEGAGLGAGAASRAACLVRGPVYGQQIRLLHGGAGSYLDVLGADTSIAMDRESKAALWSDAADSDAVTSIVSGYGYTPDVESTPGRHLEAKHALVQRESDLRFVRRLARRNGGLFWVTSDENGLETAHFRRPRLEGEPAAELAINLDPPSVETLEIAWDVERPTSAAAAQLDLNSKDELDGSVSRSPLTALGGRALAEIAAGSRSLHLAAPADDTGDLQARTEGALIEAGFFVRATCSTTTTALGALVRAHTLVKLRGAGSRHSGVWFCAGVRHTIDATTHRMEVSLLRNGWGA